MSRRVNKCDNFSHESKYDDAIVRDYRVRGESVRVDYYCDVCASELRECGLDLRSATMSSERTLAEVSAIPIDDECYPLASMTLTYLRVLASGKWDPYYYGEYAFVSEQVQDVRKLQLAGLDVMMTVYPLLEKHFPATNRIERACNEALDALCAKGKLRGWVGNNVRPAGVAPEIKNAHDIALGMK